MIKKFLLMLLMLMLTVSAFSAGNSEKSTDINKVEQITHIRLGVLPDVDSIPFVIADLNGYYGEEGIEVEIMQFKNPNDRDAAFQAGEIDLVISDLLAAAFSVNGGFDVRAVAATNGSYKLLTSAESGITSISDLTGKSIGISKNTIIEYATDKMLKAGGLSDSVIVKEIIPQIPVRLELLSNSRIDGATLAEPLATVSVTSGANVLTSTDKLGINPGILLAGTDYASENSKALTALFTAYNKAVDYLIETDKNEYIDSIISEMGFPPAAKEVMELPAYTKAAAPPEKEVKEVIEWLSSRQLIKKEYSFGELVDTSYLP